MKPGLDRMAQNEGFISFRMASTVFDEAARLRAQDERQGSMNLSTASNVRKGSLLCKTEIAFWHRGRILLPQFKGDNIQFSRGPKNLDMEM